VPGLALNNLGLFLMPEVSVRFLEFDLKLVSQDGCGVLAELL